MGVGGQRYGPAAFTPKKQPIPILQETGWASGPVWIGAEILIPTWIGSQDLPARSESLYRLGYPGPQTKIRIELKKACFDFLYKIVREVSHSKKNLARY
jgi:hypothetical protein